MSAGWDMSAAEPGKHGVITATCCGPQRTFHAFAQNGGLSTEDL